MTNRSRKVIALACLGTALTSSPTARAQAQGRGRELSLQSFVVALMRGRRGTAIVTNPRTGEVLAVTNPRTAFEQVFPPGSTAKLVESAAALEEGLITPQDRLLCRRVPELLGDAYHCTHPPSAQPFTLCSALANSCNYFFAALSLRLSSAVLAHWYSVFGFGEPVRQPTDRHASGLGRESPPGLVRVGQDAAAKARSALGEQTILATPAQLLLAYSAVATGGDVFPLRPPGGQQPIAPIRQVKLKRETRETLAEGLEESVESGMGHAAAVPGIRIAGKTGTATALGGSGATHAWFAGYAPVGDPRIALVVFLERGTGVHDAAPLAGQIFRYYFREMDVRTFSRPGGVFRGGEFRVELFSNARVSSLALRAGRDAVGVCSLSRPKRCLRAESSATVRCTVAHSMVRCSSGASRLSSRRGSVVSRSLFELDVLGAGHDNQTYARQGRVQAAELTPTPSGLHVTVTIGLEDYVAGVLAGEAGTLHSPQALRAMAVVARTWAARWHGRHGSEGFDFCSLTHCQAFRPAIDEAGEYSPAIAGAVRTTRGEVLKYGERPIDPYFSAHCGGVTEAAGEVWPDRAEPYLKSFPDPYCVATGSFSWQRSLPLEALDQVLRRDLAVPLRLPLQDLSVGDRDSSGRALVLIAWAGPPARIDANQFRFAINRRMGWNTLKSNLYLCEQRNGQVVFTGRGLGHGVGLCQAGAEQMGRLGMPYQAILATYFPGTTLGQAALTDPAAAASSEHFELVYHPDQQPWVKETLDALETLRREIEERTRTLPAKVRVRTYGSTEEFIRATGRPGWAAASSGAETIQLQPLQTLKRKGILKGTLRHELYHLALRPLRAPGVPGWFEEGMVEYLSGESLPAPRGLRDPGGNLETMVTTPRSEGEMRSAYAWALDQVKRLVREQGQEALWLVLEHPTADDLRRLRGDR